MLVAILLLSGLGLVFVEGVGYSRGGYNSAFWKLPLDEKLDHVSENRWEWWWISIWGLVGVFVMTAGVTGLTYLLVESGEPVLAFVALGGYLVALIAWVLGVVVQAASVSQAAAQRSDAGITPAWLHPFWQAGYVAEGVWVIGANLAYAVLGIAILQTGLVADWAGWAAVGAGVLIPIIVIVTRNGFPQMAILVPGVIGIALLLESL